MDATIKVFTLVQPKFETPNTEKVQTPWKLEEKKITVAPHLNKFDWLPSSSVVGRRWLVQDWSVVTHVRYHTIQLNTSTTNLCLHQRKMFWL